MPSLHADLAATTQKRQLALLHQRRFYSTTASAFDPTTSVKPFWDDLYAAGTELIIHAHMQDYERFALQTATERSGLRGRDPGDDCRDGQRRSQRAESAHHAERQARISRAYGVLKLTRYDGSDSWHFIPLAGQTATDGGTGTCQ